MIRFRYMVLIAMKEATLTATVIAVVFLSCHLLYAYEVQDCISCHKLESRESRLQISVENFSRSVHGKEFSCLDCHISVEDEDHMKISGAGCVDCGRCHEQENGHGLSKNGENRPQCFHCHTKHDILALADRMSSVHTDNLRTTCRTCHPEPCGHISAFAWLPSLRVSSHSKQDFSQSYNKHNCVGCHQGKAAHGEKYPLNDQLCYVCHIPLSSKPLLAGYFHITAEVEDQPVSFVAGTIYAIVMAFLAWAGFRHYAIRQSRSTDTEDV